MVVKIGGVGSDRGEHKWNILNCIFKYVNNVKDRMLLYSIVKYNFKVCDLSMGVFAPPGGSRGLAGDGGGGGEPRVRLWVRGRGGYPTTH